MEQHGMDKSGIAVKGAFRPLRGAWVLAWLALGAAAAALELLGG